MMSRKRAGDLITGIKRFDMGWEDLNGKALQDGTFCLLKENVLLYQAQDGITNFKVIINKKKQKKNFGQLSDTEKLRLTRKLFALICETEEVEFVKGKTFKIEELGLSFTLRRAKYSPNFQKAA